MKLLTKEIEKTLAKYPIYSQDGKKENAKILVKFFLTCSDFTAYVLEAEKHENDYEFFGIIYLNGCAEYGYFTLSELQGIKNRFGLGVERDMYFCNQYVKDLPEHEQPLKNAY
ncbi:MAG: DUF2958 domain-containing protein [Bacteroidales bacterium]|nr:DUF2958 domain-containing protein [Bacteroidales bacterium]